MPCHDPDPSRDPKMLRSKVNFLTDMLCRTLAQSTGPVPPDVLKWYENHQEMDRKIKAAKEKMEKLKAAGDPTPFWSLTPNERNLVWDS